MSQSKSSRSGGRQAPPAAREVDTKNKQTPNTDMQPDDTGTGESGNASRGTAVESAMKQTSKTPHETGSKGR